MRIIAGEKRSRKLVAPEGMDTRPTADRAKEALFSILMSRLPGARVLDLYAGSGALALEALSRGAGSAVLADLSPKACKVIEQNIATLDYQQRARLLRCADMAAITQLRREGAAFDLIFLDPPYRMGLIDRALAGIVQYDLLENDGWITAETALDEGFNVPEGLKIKDTRRYGKSLLYFMERG